MQGGDSSSPALPHFCVFGNQFCSLPCIQPENMLCCACHPVKPGDLWQDACCNGTPAEQNARKRERARRYTGGKAESP
ncbi:hypothetical protein D7X33_12735 [Butyricicoccus sp. 1XD8-22]|nr:hypothetical protein D7X33_12735 [Butyricicoccus sp. 1XD8-22]